MRILVLTTHVNLGGIGIYVLLQAKGLLQKGHRVFVASSGGDLVSQLESLGAEHLRVDIKTKAAIGPKVILARKEIVKIVRDREIELIHAHTRVTQVLAELVCKQTGTPFVTTCHGFFQPRMFRKIFPCWGDYSIAISEAVRAHLVNDLGVRKEKVAVVHNGVEIERFSPDKFTQAQKIKFKQEYALPAEAAVVGTIARLSSVKGQRYLITAMQKVTAVFPEAQLLLVGEGPEKEKLLEQTKKLRLENNVTFASSTLDTCLPLSIMDVFVFPSILEGLGLAIIEAQAMALPVVATDVGGIYTLVKDGVNGYLVPPGDPNILAEKILKLLQDKKLAQHLGRQARKQAQADFDLRKMIEGIEGVYKKVLKR